MDPEFPIRYTSKIGPSGQIVGPRGSNRRPFMQLDRDVFLILPGKPGDRGWFHLSQVDSGVRNSRRHCDRLVGMGVLETKMIGTGRVGMEPVYRTLGCLSERPGDSPAVRRPRGAVDTDLLAMEEEAEHAQRCEAQAGSIHTEMRRACKLLDHAKQSYEELEREAPGRISEPVSANLREAHARLHEAVEYLDAVVRGEV